jgi:hypothetical protein
MRTQQAPLSPAALLKRLLIAAVVAYALWYTLRMVAMVGIASKAVECMKEGDKPPEHATSAQMHAVAVGMADCLDAKANFLERIWFDREEMVAGIRFGKPRADNE